ncbi:MAG: hypothetical protein HGA44_07875, partial [Cellulomonadaceae bacterium]|nr:hypothetical protein [Cellulomonadaceae bacterium]
DAQGRTGAGELVVDLQGYPAAPASVTAAAYTASGVTLDVALGDGAGAHPAVDGVSVYEDGRPVDATCRSTSPSSFRCEVAGLVNGQPHAFTARSRNAVGESTDSTAVTTWAYRGPEIGSVTAEPVYDASATTPTHGVVRLTIESADDAAAFQVSTLGQPVQRSGEQTTVMLTLPVGGQTVTVTPLSRFTPPSGAVDASGQSREVAVTVAGSPLVSPGTATTQAQQVVVSGAAVDPNGSTRLTSLQVGAFTRADAARCTMANGQAVLTGQGAVSGSGTIDGLANDTEYTVVACGSNGYGAAMVTVGTVYVFAGFDVPQVRSGYRIGTSPVRSGAVFTWASVTQPDVRTTEPQVVLRYRVDGGSWSDAVSLPTGRLAPLVEVRQCSRLHADACSDPVEVPMVSGSAPGTVVVTFPTTCLAEPAASDVGLAPSGLNDDGAAAVVEVATETRTDRGVDYLVSTWTVTWTGAYAALDTVSADDAAARCVAPPPP